MRIASFVLAYVVAQAAHAGETPNVLLVVLDDVGVDRIGCYAEAPEPGRTPTIDSIAANGVMFRNAYASPLCTPSRFAFITGVYPHRYGAGESIDGDAPMGPPVDGSFDYLPQLLSGYRCGAFGKWHMSNIFNGWMQHPLLVGFETHKGSPGVLEDYFGWQKFVDGIKVGKSTTYATSATVSDAAKFIRKCGSDPWFVYLAFNAPHLPAHVPPADLHTYDDELDPPPPWDDDAYMKAALEALDLELLRLFLLINPATLANTVVIVMGDNGTLDDYADPNFLPAKGTLAEGGINVPLLISGPGLPSGVERSGLVQHVDVFSTILDITGHEQPPDRDGISFAQYAKLGLEEPRSMIYAHLLKESPPPVVTREHRKAARDARYKIIRNVLSGDVEFYDLLLDPCELSPLSTREFTLEQFDAFVGLQGFIDSVDP